MAVRDKLERDLDVDGHRLRQLAHASAADEPVRKDDMDTAIAAAVTSAVVTTSTPPVPVTKAAAVLGVDPAAAHGDHKHDVTTAAAVATGTANAEGTATSLARSDHVHLTSFAGVAAALAAASTDIPVNSRKLTLLADGSAPQDAPAFHQIADALAASAPVVANAATLIALNVGDGAIRRVATYRDFFFLDKSPPAGRALAADDVLQSTVNAAWQWVRMHYADPSWGAQGTWYWNASTGDNQNDGADPARPFLTHEEFYRRTNGLFTSPTIIVQADVPTQTMRLGVIGTVTYKAVLIPIAGGTGSFTSRPSNQDHSANTAYNLTDSALATSWTAGNGTTSYVNKMLVARDGLGAIVGVTFVDRDLGAKTMRPGPVASAAPVLAVGDAIQIPTSDGTLSNGNTYTMYDLVKFAPAVIACSIVTNVRAYGLNFLNGFVSSGMQQFIPTHCYFSNKLDNRGPLFQPHQCVLNAFSMATGNFAGFARCLLLRGNVVIQTTKFTLNDDCIYSGGGGFMSISQGSTLLAADFGVFDGNQLQILSNSSFGTGRLWGNNNGSSQVMLVSDFGCRWVWNPSTPPVVTGAAAPIMLGPITLTLAEIIAGTISYPGHGAGIAQGI